MRAFVVLGEAAHVILSGAPRAILSEAKNLNDEEKILRSFHSLRMTGRSEKNERAHRIGAPALEKRDLSTMRDSGNYFASGR